MSFDSKANPLDPIRKASEEEFFRKQNAALAAELKARVSAGQLGVKDPELVKKITALGFDSDSFRALFMAPLVQVAWADGEVQANEKIEILELLKARGITADSKAYALVKLWVEKGASDPSFQNALSILNPLLEELKKNNPDSLSWMTNALNQVAEATGGLFGIGIGNKVSDAEKKVIRKIVDKIS